MKGPDAVIFSLGNKLPVGGQLSGQECPFCSKRSGEARKSLSVTREISAIVYQCHSSNCQAKGWVRAEGSSAGKEGVKPSPNKWATYLRYAAPLLDSEKKWCADKWKMDDRHLRRGLIEYSPASRRIILPIINSAGEEIGASLRAMLPAATPKSMIVLTKDDSLCMSFYRGTANPDVWIVVEDQASALRASMYCSAVALLGVYVDAVRAREISKLKPDRVLWCLDKDAFQKTILLAQKYGHIMKNSAAVCPPKDLKDMTEDELKSFLAYECKIDVELVEYE